MNKNIKPILKWAGGKKQLYHEIRNRFPKVFDTYHEPFLGGGFVFLTIQPQKAILNDLNEELINVYQTIKENPHELINELKKFKNTPEFFYKTRSLDRDYKKFSKLSNINRAARIIYLNKTCFNGLYRVNSQGQLNSPFGFYKNPLICDSDTILEMSKYFNNKRITFVSGDFDFLKKKMKTGDFVYLDPPYDPVSCSSSFTGYCSGGFGKFDQERLKIFCDELNKKGIKFLLSNSDTLFINELYKEYKIEKVLANRCINSNSAKRNKVSEVLVRNYE